MVRAINCRRLIWAIFISLLVISPGWAGTKEAKPIDHQAARAVQNQDLTPATQEASEALPIQAAGMQQTGEEINWQVISGGGDIGGSSTNFQVSGTVGQTAIGSGVSVNFGLYNGFWLASDVECDCLPGDANGDGEVNVGDAVYIINYVFKGGPPPTPYTTCSGDANGDCETNVGDAVYIINYVFKGGASPVTCEQWLIDCGLPIRK